MADSVLETQKTEPAAANAEQVAAIDGMPTRSLGDAGEPSALESKTGAAPATAVRSEPLAAGATVDAFTVARVLAANTDERRYLAYETQRGGDAAAAASERADTAKDSGYVILIERGEGQLGGVAQHMALDLRHPRLLAGRTAFAADGHDFLAFDTFVAADGSPAPTAASGARLDAVATLTAGAGLADALAYLHRNRIAHLHVSPDVLVVHGGRVYLSGVETAEYIGALLDDASVLFARDANFLARSLGVLADLPAEATDDEPVAQASLRSIVAHGVAGGFLAPADVAAACTAALQQAGPASSLLAVEHPHDRLQLLFGAATSVGLVRSENQDAYATFVWDMRDDLTKEAPFGVFLVADGMGGEARGEVASRIAARLVVTELLKSFAAPMMERPAIMEMSEVPTAVLRAISMKGNLAEAMNGAHLSPNNGSATGDPLEPESELRRALRRAVGVANQQVRELAGQLGQTTGTTLTAMATLGSRAELAHLGDSRAYLLRGDLVAQLTEDHSVLARLQAIDHPLLSDPDVIVPRNMLYRSLGQEDDAGPDMLSVTLADGDRLVICSDGLWDEIPPEALAQTLAQAETPQQCAEQLVALANGTGGHDNSTAVVVFVRGPRDDITTDDDTNGTDDTGQSAPTVSDESHAESAGDHQEQSDT